MCYPKLSIHTAKEDVIMWTVEWTAISARIAGLIEAASVYLTELRQRETGALDVSGDLLQNANGVFQQLQLFQTNHAAALPQEALTCLRTFLHRYSGGFTQPAGGPPKVQSVVTLLASFRAEFAYLVSDTEAVARSRVARAFTHLQRSIVADDGIRATWKRAFQNTKTGETACEKLGATHLLLHGVWAFKANAQGGRTDLVLGSPLMVDDRVRAAADALVLTEWKVARDEKELDEKAREAYDQAHIYSSGILAGFELSSRRYLVIVSSDRLPMPDSRQDGTVMYEYVNVPVAPDVPSKQSRRKHTIDAS
jgi:hypothetical protein